MCKLLRVGFVNTALRGLLGPNSHGQYSPVPVWLHAVSVSLPDLKNKTKRPFRAEIIFYLNSQCLAEAKHVRGSRKLVNLFLGENLQNQFCRASPGPRRST